MNLALSNTVTMTSLELVDFINADRGHGEAELTHANFMAKVPKVLGEGGLIRFQDTYQHPQNGQNYPMYRFPKREASLMAMSYSYELQAKVFDKMTALEANTAPEKTLANPQLAAMVLLLQQLDATQQEQKRQALEVSQIQETIAVLEARTQPENKHFTLMGYANLMGHKLDLSTASKLGKKCAKLSRDLGVIMGSVKDPRFGKVLSYHESILESVLAPITH